MNEELNRLALDLEDCIPAEHKATAAINPTGVIADVLAIVGALKSGDYKTAALAVAKLIEDLIGQQDQVKGPFQNINWANIIAIISKILPLVLGV